MRAEPAWRAWVNGKRYDVTAPTRGEARAKFKALLHIPRKGRLPRGISIVRLPEKGGKGV